MATVTQPIPADPRDYADRRCTPGDAALAINVANTDFTYARFSKWVTYAATACRLTGYGP